MIELEHVLAMEVDGKLTEPLDDGLELAVYKYKSLGSPWHRVVVHRPGAVPRQIVAKHDAGTPLSAWRRVRQLRREFTRVR